MTEGGPSSPTAHDFTVLRWLVRRDCATASQIGAACGLIPAEVRTHLAWLETICLVSSRPDTDSKPARRVYFVTAEGRRKAGVSDARARDA